MRFLWPILLVGAFFILSRHEVFPWPFTYDEADYMYAASLGWRANYTDSPSQDFAGFVRAGSGDSTRAALSRAIRSSDDVDFYRHWHGPLYFYWLLLLRPLGLSEPAARALGYLFPVLTALCLFFGALWLRVGRGGILSGILSSALYLWSYATVFSNEIAPHQLFALCYVAGLLFLMKWRSGGGDRYWYAAVVAAACAFATLEVAFVLVIVLAWFAPRRLALKSLLVWAGTVVAAWPGAFFKLSAAKAYLFMGYLALSRKSPWGSVSFAETWHLRITQSPWEWLLLGVAAVLYFRFCPAETRRLLAPVVSYAVLVLALLLRVTTDTPRYMLPFLPALQFFAGFVFAAVIVRWTLPKQAVAVTALCSLVLWNTTSQIRAHPIRPADLAQRLNTVREVSGRRLLVPQRDLPMFHYYFPNTELWGYADEAERRMLSAREDFDRVLR